MQDKVAPTSLSSQPDLVGLSEAAPITQNEKQTAKQGIKIMVAKNEGYLEPDRAQRLKLGVVFAERGKALYGKAYDLVKLPSQFNFDQTIKNPSLLSRLQFCEVKSTKQANIGREFRGYFFDLTTAELLVAQTLGDQYRFLLVHTLTKHYLSLSLRELYSRTRNIYPKWAVQL